MEHKGVSYELTPKELKYLLFKKKQCPRCAGVLTKSKTYDTMKGAEINSKADPIFIANADIKQYRYIFTCQYCKTTFTLRELAE